MQTDDQQYGQEGNQPDGEGREDQQRAEGLRGEEDRAASAATLFIDGTRDASRIRRRRSKVSLGDETRPQPVESKEEFMTEAVRTGRSPPGTARPSVNK